MVPADEVRVAYAYRLGPGSYFSHDLGVVVHLRTEIRVGFHAINEWCARGRRLMVATSLCHQHNWTRFCRHGPRVAARKVWLEVLRPVAAEMQTCASQLAGRIVDRYQSELPKIVPDAPAVAEQLVSVEASLRQIARCIETGDDPRREDLAPATAAIARSGVQRNIPLNDLIRSVRLAHEETWRWLFDQITGTAPTAGQAKALELATNWLFAYTDNLPVKAEHLYEIEREAWLSGAAAARAAAIDDILNGREDDPRVETAAIRHRSPSCRGSDMAGGDAWCRP